MAATEEADDETTTTILPVNDNMVGGASTMTAMAQPDNDDKNYNNHNNGPRSSIVVHRGSSLGSLDEQLQAVTLVAKFGKERVITLDQLDAHRTTIAQVKEMLQYQTRVLPKRQKLIGLVALQGGARGVHDDLLLSELKVKNNNNNSNCNGTTTSTITHQFILMGTPEEDIFVDPSERDDLPDVLDDFGLEFNAGSDEWLHHKAAQDNLKKFTAQTPVHVMNPPREGKPLLVLDLDHTLLDFSSKTLQQDQSTRIPGQGMAAAMKRPFMDEFLVQCYQYYDLVVWSQTSWRWLETKLIELGMVSHPHYKFCFVLDKTSMFTIVSTKRDGSSVQHHVKPLEIIWRKFAGRWGPHNTVHIDDLSRNFALNLGNGLKCTAFFRKKSTSRRDTELLGLAKYLLQLAQTPGVNFEKVDFASWMDVVSGKKKIKVDDDSSDPSDAKKLASK